ncbi:MAG: vanadium-dependent haloperoxidase, partial [Actinomycetota bacterium]|nr:vanadium-dependent haloperoxidase [Actinomycetota bacterium]
MATEAKRGNDGHEECMPWPPPPVNTYSLPGPQVEPAAGYWTKDPCKVPCVVRIDPDLIAITDDATNDCHFPDYPTTPAVLDAEIQELLDLAQLRDDPDAVASNESDRRRLAISPFLQLRPQPIGAVFNRLRAEDEPVIKTGRELARYFENETPGLAHRHALNFLIPDTGWSPPRQALVWAALDITIYSALLAAWHYKWFTNRAQVRYRPRPIEADYRVSVLYNRAPNATQSGDGEQRPAPNPSPGTPRHPAYPSGHSTYGGAASELLSFFFPDYTAEFDMLADNTGMARLWGGIHWRSDHEQGIHLGRCVARQVIAQLQAGCVCPPDPCDPPDPCQQPPTHEELLDQA